MDSAIRYDVSGRYAVAYSADGKRLGWVVSAQPNGTSAMLTTIEPDDLDESMTERIVEMTRSRIQIAREIARELKLRRVSPPDRPGITITNRAAGELTAEWLATELALTGSCGCYGACGCLVGKAQKWLNLQWKQDVEVDSSKPRDSE